MTEDELKEAHKHASNRPEVERSESVGCFHCCRVYPPSEIKEWVGIDKDSALCPHCGIDSVIGSASGIDLSPEFLKEMEAHWFAYTT